MGLSSPGIAKHTGSRHGTGQTGRPGSTVHHGRKTPGKKASRHPHAGQVDLVGDLPSKPRWPQAECVDLTKDSNFAQQPEPVLVSKAFDSIELAKTFICLGIPWNPTQVVRFCVKAWTDIWRYKQRSVSLAGIVRIRLVSNPVCLLPY